METEMSPEARGRILHLDVPIDSDDELSALHGALLAARASELSQVRRRGDRLSFGYGSDSAREGMNAEVGHAERRWAMIDRLIGVLDEASARAARGE
jgi:hypothetical protein